jgi:GAF domain-containing protein
MDYEAMRIAALKRFNILDTPPDGSFDKMTLLASKVFNVPISIISLVDEDRIWFKSHYGIAVNEIGKEPGLCASAILSEDVYLVEDARKDLRTLTNSLVAGEFGLQFYAAWPLITSEGYRLGTFCILDKRPRYLNTDQKDMLKLMGDIVMQEMEIRLEARNTVEKLDKSRIRA